MRCQRRHAHKRLKPVRRRGRMTARRPWARAMTAHSPADGSVRTSVCCSPALCACAMLHPRSQPPLAPARPSVSCQILPIRVIHKKVEGGCAQLCYVQKRNSKQEVEGLIPLAQLRPSARASSHKPAPRRTSGGGLRSPIATSCLRFLQEKSERERGCL